MLCLLSLDVEHDLRFGCCYCLSLHPFTPHRQDFGPPIIPPPLFSSAHFWLFGSSYLEFLHLRLPLYPLQFCGCLLGVVCPCLISRFYPLFSLYIRSRVVHEIRVAKFIFPCNIESPKDQYNFDDFNSRNKWNAKQLATQIQTIEKTFCGFVLLYFFGSVYNWHGLLLPCCSRLVSFLFSITIAYI